MLSAAAAYEPPAAAPKRVNARTGRGPNGWREGSVNTPKVCLEEGCNTTIYGHRVYCDEHRLQANRRTRAAWTGDRNSIGGYAQPRECHEDGCTNKPEPQKWYCEEHRERMVPVGGEGGLKMPRFEECQYEGCSEPLTEGRRHYCDEHRSEIERLREVTP